MTSWTLKLTLTFLLTIGNASVIPLKLLCPIEKSIGLILAFNMLIFQIQRSKAFIRASTVRKCWAYENIKKSYHAQKLTVFAK